MFKTNEEAEKYFSEKYNKNITFSEIYQDQETLQFHRDVLVDGVKTEDKELVEKIRQEQISNFGKVVNQKDWTINSEDKSFCGTPMMNEEEDRQATFEALKLLKELRKLGMNLGEDIDESLRKTIVVSNESEGENE